MHTCVHPLRFLDGHPFLELDGELWLYDTGSPLSFGRTSRVRAGGLEAQVPAGMLGLDADMLGGFVGRRIAGLLGVDVLARHDWILDLDAGTATAGDRLELAGASTALDDFMGLPIVSVDIGGRAVRMVFDTGAQLSYWEDDALAAHRVAGEHDDFFPGLGAFRVQAHHVPLHLAGTPLMTRCARLPRLLALTLSLAGVAGVLGSEVLHDRAVGWFPRRGELVLGPRG